MKNRELSLIQKLLLGGVVFAVPVISLSALMVAAKMSQLTLAFKRKRK